MPLIQTADLTEASFREFNSTAPEFARHQVYNGLDCTVTYEVHEALTKLLHSHEDQTPQVIYNFERALQGPILEIMLRGFLVDEPTRQLHMADLQRTIGKLQTILDAYAQAIWGQGLNPRSHPQLKAFFYGQAGLRLPEIWISDKGVRKLSFKREVLEKLESYFYAMPVIAVILAIREHAKQLEILATEIDPDGRMRTSYNIGGTETGRLSSSSNAFGTGGNLQNIPPKRRRIFVADPGYKLCVIDLEQAEAREVGWLCGTLFDRWGYLEACERGDLHTENSKLIWPKLAWTGDARRDRELADQNFYRDFSYRDMSKRGGHGTSYKGSAWTIARHLKVPVQLIVDFQSAFFSARPEIQMYHQWCGQQIQMEPHSITTPFGRTRHFFGRHDSDNTLREAIAYSPQGSTADRTNLGMLRHWQHFRTDTQLLAQTHDSITFQFKQALEPEIVPLAVKIMEIELTCPKRSFVIPGEAKTGWNWAYHHDTSKPTGPKNPLNPDGLKKFKIKDDRKRLEGLQQVLG